MVEHESLDNHYFSKKRKKRKMNFNTFVNLQLKKEGTKFVS